MAQCRRVLLWVVIVTTVLTVVECTCHEQGSDTVPAPVITSVEAKRVSDSKSDILIKWTDPAASQIVNRYAFFFGLETNGQMCVSAGTLSKAVAEFDAADVDNGVFSATLKHSLDPFVRYTAQVAQDWAGNNIGRKSEAFEFTLNATLTFEEPEENSVLIHWPKRTTDNITGFKWECSTEGLEDFVDKRESTGLGNSITSAELDDLEEGARYRVSVQASTENLRVVKETLTTIVKTRAAKPAKPQNLTGVSVGSEIALAWRPPPPRDRNGDITAYEIKWTIESTLSEVLDVMVKANGTHRAEWNYTIPAVQRGVIYIVDVAAVNEAGTGEYARIRVPTPPPPSTDYKVTIQDAGKRINGLGRQARKRVQKMMTHCDALQTMGMQCMIAFMPDKEDHTVTTYGSPELVEWLKDMSSPVSYKDE